MPEALRFPGFLIQGISLVAPVKPITDTALQPIINIHANYVSLMPYSFCTPENPVIQYNHRGQWWGESDEGVIGCIELAHKNKLSVMLKPHLWIAHGIFTGSFTLHTEKDWLLWEDSYRAYMLHFATIADSLRVELVCIGTELETTIKERPEFWNSLIDSIKQVYHGKLTYAANWDEYQHVPFWEKLDYIGVDAYFPLSSERTPSVNTLQDSWKKYHDALEKISMQHQRPIVFTEYGYRNVDHNGAEPWKENEGAQNDEAQANALEALYKSFAGDKWFAGGYVWKWYTDDTEIRHHHSKIDFTPQNKSAEKIIQTWYKK